MGFSRSAPRLWEDFELARYLNRYLGTDIRPWELSGAPELYIDAFLEMIALRGELAESGLLKR